MNKKQIEKICAVPESGVMVIAANPDVIKLAEQGYFVIR